MSRIHVSIDRLVLPDVDPAERQAIVRALEAELRRTLADPAARAAWAKAHRTPVLRLAPIPLEKGLAGARNFGTTMARSIGKGLKP
jgi:hypothetical protein